MLQLTYQLVNVQKVLKFKVKREITTGVIKAAESKHRLRLNRGVVIVKSLIQINYLLVCTGSVGVGVVC
jgi:hypothetical protein